MTQAYLDREHHGRLACMLGTCCGTVRGELLAVQTKVLLLCIQTAFQLENRHGEPP